MNTSLSQDCTIQCIAVDNTRSLQFLRKCFCTASIKFDYLGVGILKIQFNFTRKHQSDTATTSYDHRACLALIMAEAGHCPIQMRAITYKIDAVTRFHSLDA